MSKEEIQKYLDEKAKASGLKPVSIVFGAQLRDEGIRRAVEHADAVEDRWSGRALAWVKTIAERGGTLTSESVMDEAYATGLPVPPEPRAWGGIMQAAAKRGWIKRDGFVESGHARAHCRPIARWRSCLR